MFNKTALSILSILIACFMLAMVAKVKAQTTVAGSIPAEFNVANDILDVGWGLGGSRTHK